MSNIKNILSGLIVTDEKIINKINNNLDYTAFEIYANDTDIVSGIYNNILSGIVSETILSGMTLTFNLRTNGLVTNSDVIVDWGDNTKSIVANGLYLYAGTSDYSNNVLMTHTYTNTGKYIIKIYGKDYFAVSHAFVGINGHTLEDVNKLNLMCRCFALDLPIASHIHNLASFAFHSMRLLNVKFADYKYLQNLTNVTQMFRGCYNLLTVTELLNKLSMVQKFSGLFCLCTNLTNTDFVIPSNSNIGSLGINLLFSNCYKLTSNIASLIPNGGFSNKGLVNTLLTFYMCSNINGTVPANLLWLDTTVKWVLPSDDTQKPFYGCSDTIKEQVPTSWGGSNTLIQAKLDSGYYNNAKLSGANFINAVSGADFTTHTGIKLSDRASKTYVDDRISAIISGAPETLDTLKEIADALSAHHDIISGIIDVINTKTPLSSFNEHILSTDCHVTLTEKEIWTNKQDEINLNNKLSAAYIDGLSEVLTGKVDKISGYSLVEDSQILKLEGLPEDYTAFEVYATNSDIAEGTVDSVTGLTYTVNIPACMTEKFIIRSNKNDTECDVIIDWGDGTKSIVANGEHEKEAEKTSNAFIMTHTYSAEGRYIVKVYGKDYYNINHDYDSFSTTYKISNHLYNILSRCLDTDLPLASFITNMSSFAYGAYKLLKIVVPSYMYLGNIVNANTAFSLCTNLKTATGFSKNFTPYIGSNVFSYSSNLSSVDYIIPNMVDNNTVFQSYSSCIALTTDISKLLPKKRFTATKLNTGYMFYRCANLTGSVPSDILWEDDKITWTTNSNAFTGCSDAIRAQVPTSWGGTNTLIQAKLDSGYYKKASLSGATFVGDVSISSGNLSFNYIPSGSIVATQISMSTVMNKIENIESELSGVNTLLDEIIG